MWVVWVNNIGVFNFDFWLFEVVFFIVVCLDLFIVVVVFDLNVVCLDWFYNGDVVSVFRVFRNGVFLVDVFVNDRNYWDYEGILFFELMYSIVVFLSWEDMLF